MLDISLNLLKDTGGQLFPPNYVAVNFLEFQLILFKPIGIHLEFPNRLLHKILSYYICFIPNKSLSEAHSISFTGTPFVLDLIGFNCPVPFQVKGFSKMLDIFLDLLKDTGGQ